MSEQKGYNGWTNYETWNVALWYDNDQGSQEYWAERAVACLEDAEADSVNTKEENATFKLMDEMKDQFEENNPLEDAGPYTDLLNAAISEINWYEIAESYIKQAVEDNQ